MDELLTKPKWWNNNKYCDYHCMKAQKTTSCFQLKHEIKDLIDDRFIAVDPSLLFSNSDHTIFKDPLENHDKGQASNSNTNTQSSINYTHTGHDYTINCLNESNSHVSTLTLRNEDPHCFVTIYHTKITLLGAPRPNASIASSNYNLFNQLGKTPTQISTVDLLQSSPQHQKILDQALKDSVVPNNIDVAKFQVMAGNFSTSQHTTFSP